MIRCRFLVDAEDPRPINWPIAHPYWISGETDKYNVLIAYAEDEAEIMRNWPDAYSLDSEQVEAITFTGRFPRPRWYHGEA